MSNDASFLGAVRTLAADIGFTEGPVWTGRSVIVTSITRGELREVSLDGTPSRVLARPGGGPNGLAFESRTGTIWIAQNGRVHMPHRSGVADRRPGIQSIVDGEVQQPLTVAVGAPNDCVIGPDGRLWFTEPDGDPHGPVQKVGRVWAWDPSTGSRELQLETDGYPNGLTFGADPDRLFVAETRYARVREFAVDGGLREVSRLTLERGFPDGLAVAADGTLFVAGTSSGTVEIFSPDGVLRASLDLGADSMPTNVCFAGDQLDQLVVTVARGGRVLALDCELRGLELPSALRSLDSEVSA